MFLGTRDSRWTWSAPSPGCGRSTSAGQRRVATMAGEPMTSRLALDPALVRQARELAAAAGQPIVELARTHTTVSVERAVLRLAGLAAAAGKAKFRLPQGTDATAARSAAHAALAIGFTQIDARRAERDAMIRATSDPPKPWIYLIVATGDIHEDIPQAQAAARAGADIVAVIRSTGQSLLDYVPQGATREGYAGTYATRENFRLMRAALDETSRELGRD